MRAGCHRNATIGATASGRAVNPNAFFNTSWYLAQYPDVVASDMNPLDHYHLYGSHDLRDPGPLFETRWYLARYPDVRAAGIDPLLHYLRRGFAEGRLPGRRGVAGGGDGRRPAGRPRFPP